MAISLLLPLFLLFVLAYALAGGHQAAAFQFSSSEWKDLGPLPAIGVGRERGICSMAGTNFIFFNGGTAFDSSLWGVMDTSTGSVSSLTASGGSIGNRPPPAYGQNFACVNSVRHGQLLVGRGGNIALTGGTELDDFWAFNVSAAGGGEWLDWSATLTQEEAPQGTERSVFLRAWDAVGETTVFKMGHNVTELRSFSLDTMQWSDLWPSATGTPPDLKSVQHSRGEFMLTSSGTVLFLKRETFPAFSAPRLVVYRYSLPLNAWLSPAGSLSSGEIANIGAPCCGYGLVSTFFPDYETIFFSNGIGSANTSVCTQNGCSPSLFMRGTWFFDATSNVWSNISSRLDEDVVLGVCSDLKFAGASYRSWCFASKTSNIWQLEVNNATPPVAVVTSATTGSVVAFTTGDGVAGSSSTGNSVGGTSSIASSSTSQLLATTATARGGDEASGSAEEGFPVGLVVGILGALVCVVFLLVGAAFFVLRRKKQQRGPRASKTSESASSQEMCEPDIPGDYRDVSDVRGVARGEKSKQDVSVGEYHNVLALRDHGSRVEDVGVGEYHNVKEFRDSAIQSQESNHYSGIEGVGKLAGNGGGAEDHALAGAVQNKKELEYSSMPVSGDVSAGAPGTDPIGKNEP